jgi:cytosine/adenosine deaminase-related metal-dependent hydrolase
LPEPTVVDHFPAEVSGTFTNHALVSLLEHFYLAHSVSPHQLQWGRNTSEQFRQARGILPFILHAGEGNSNDIREEIETLNRLGALDKNTVIVNGCFLQESDLQLIAMKGASMVWLPGTCNSVYSQHPDINRILDLGIPLTIGTDSSISGSGNILDVLKTARAYSHEHLQGRLSDADLIRMATGEAAAIFGMEKQLGMLSSGKRADFIVMPDNPQKDPFTAVIAASPEDFSMVVHRGTMITGNDEFRRISSIDFSLYSEVRINGTAKLLYGQPIQLLERVRHKLSREIIFPFFNITAEE